MKIKTRNNKKMIALATALVIGALIAGGVFAWRELRSTPANTSVTSSENDSLGINYNPPTKQEVAESQNAKKNSGVSNDGTDMTDDRGTVQVGITYADIYNDMLEIRAFTNGVVDGSGVCTAIVTNGTQRIEKKSKAFIDATSSVCRPIYIPLSNLSSGTWEVTVDFSTKEKTGKSDTVLVRVP